MLNLPNTLTLLRTLLGPVIPFMMVYGDFGMRIWFSILFTFAAVSDWFDGWYARRYNMITAFGKILDPIADKALMLGCFWAFSDLSPLGLYSFWWLIPIFVREIGITVYRFWLLAKRKPEVVAASNSGKFKTIIQIVCLVAAYFYFMLREYAGWDWDGLRWIMYAALASSVAMTLYSGWRVVYKRWAK